MDLFTRYHPDLVHQCLHEGLAGGQVAIADDVVNVRLQSVQVLLGQRDGLLVPSSTTSSARRARRPPTLAVRSVMRWLHACSGIEPFSNAAK